MAPGSTVVTSDATSTTRPQNSQPGTNGGSVFTWYFPAIVSTSGKFTDAAAMATRTPPATIGGDGMSETTRTSGPPSRGATTACTSTLPSLLLCALADAGVRYGIARNQVGLPSEARAGAQDASARWRSFSTEHRRISDFVSSRRRRAGC